MVTRAVKLGEEDAEALAKIASREGTTVPQLIKQGIDRLLNDATYDERWERATAVLGRYSSGLPDVGLRHDDYLAEDFG